MENRTFRHHLSRKIIWTIESFSQLFTEKIYSEIFFAGGYKWQILIFPKGNTNVDHLAIYLTLVDSASLPTWSCLQIELSLGVLNQISQDNTLRKGAQHEYSVNSGDFGFSSLVPLTILNDETKGFIVNDRIVLEAEITSCPVTFPHGFRFKSQTIYYKGQSKMKLLDSHGEDLELCSSVESQTVKASRPRKITWTIEYFSPMRTKKIFSEVFSVGGFEWQIMIFVKNGKDLAMCLSLVDSAKLEMGSRTRTRVKFSVGLVNQVSEHCTLKQSGEHDLSFSLTDFGFGSISPLDVFKDESNGYIMNGSVIFEAEIAICQVTLTSGIRLKRPLSNSEDEVSRRKKKGKMVMQEELIEQRVRSQVGAQEIDPFDKMAIELLEKLEDEKIVSKAVKLRDFDRSLPVNFINFGIFHIPENLKSYAEKIFARSEDVAAQLCGVHHVNEMGLAVLCSALKNMEATPISDVTELMIMKWRDAINMALELGFKVEFLMDDLRNTTIMYLQELAGKPFPKRELHLRAGNKIVDSEKLGIQKFCRKYFLRG